MTVEIKVQQTKQRPMPQSLETERIVFGAVFVDNSTFGEIADKPADLFISQRHREIFLAMKHVHAQGQDINPLTVKNAAKELHLEHAGIGEAGLLAQFAIGVPSFTSISSYVKILEDCAARRRVIERARAMANKLYEMEDVRGALLAFESEIEHLKSEGEAGRQGLMRFGDAIAGQVEQWRQFTEGRVAAVESGLYELDEQLTGGGYTKGMFHVVGGVPGMGKSSLAIDIAGNAVTAGRSVVYFTLELSREVFIDRFLSPFANVPRYRIAPRWLKQPDVDTLTETALALEKSFFWIDDRATGIEEMEETLKQVAKVTGGEIDLIIVDYAQRMSGRGDSEHQKIKNNVDYLCRAAKVYNSAVVALTQFKRRRPEDFFVRPVLDWFKESGSIGEAARTATVLWQTKEQFDDYERTKEMRRGGQFVPQIKPVTVSVIKQGEGAEFDIEGVFNTETMTFGVRQPLQIHRAESPVGVNLGVTDTESRISPQNEASGHASSGKRVISDDQKGNLIYQKGADVFLKLVTEPQARHIATIVGTGHLLCKRIRETHLHRATNAYGFNWHLVNSGRFDRYTIRDESGEYTISTEQIKQYKVMNFNGAPDGNDYELQYFVPLDVLTAKEPAYEIAGVDDVENYF